jgi:hypothetical protein
MEARAYARFQAESASFEAKMERRQSAEESGKKPRGRAPQAPSAAPEAKDQVNFTDEESRIMKTKDGFQQCYNAQAGVDTDSRLILGQRVSQSPNDKQELAEDLKVVKENASPAVVLIDSGFVSESTVVKIESENPGLQVLAAMERQPHGRTVKQLEKCPEPEPPGADADFATRMKYRTTTTAGRTLYKLRQQTVEPIFGIIKEAMGFRRFSLRGHAKVSLEWNLVCLAYNLKRLHIVGANLRAA